MPSGLPIASPATIASISCSAPVEITAGAIATPALASAKIGSTR